MDPAQVEAEVRSFFAEYKKAFRSREPAAIQKLYPEDGFTWYEDGALRYSSVDEILTGLSAFPEGMTLETTLSETEIVPLSESKASVGTLFKTVIGNPSGSPIEFGGVMTMVLDKTAAGWRIRSGHTSTPKPRGR